MSNKYDVVVIGAGAAGLMCAAEAGKRGRKVLVLDNAKKPGRKIIISGGGRCNFTNYDVTANNFLCQNPHFVKSALSQYTNWDFISMVYKYGIDVDERDHGQLFCQDNAKQIVDMLLKECELAEVNLRLRTEIESIEKVDTGFKLETNTDEIECESLVVATGGLSMPKLGATPYGYHIAEQFGIPVIPTTAGLVPFTLHKQDKEDFETLSGIAIPTEITAEDGTLFKEALLFTHRGLSGPSVLQISSFWKPGQQVSINLVPEADVMELLTESREKHPNQNLKNTLSKVLPKRFVEVLIDRKELTDKPLKQFNSKEMQAIHDHLENWPVLPNGTEGYRTAEVTLGGVDTDHLSSKTMEAKNVSGLYFVGEVMDVTGWLGGYNFQWAWSSGYVAGQYA
ncbi:NAD(P)/FAD-dependent oxidoreductase [Vibrio tapetis]|uniref:Putative oxidoreductase with FAD/NAD(P)-binding domain n=1 Tax=Vibrio tapetis subsp. tapetis TaxID=1671868 RepID=A0A2N8ZGT1_9VIBR|nr:NAD(P)/FAD-dependent oxidoreductase [Vibrio tapetis]SON51119.1 putative oxidoreductase with FAD/NAD(P)-binding domain [Vibrio tapetis subsp. tapetis]